MIEQIKVTFDESKIIDLKERLNKTRWPDEIENSHWEYGTSLSYMQELSDYWIKDFEWRKVEKEINAYPNFIADIDGYKIHFLHIKGKGEKVIPLIITHGWPGSFLEMMKLIPLLTTSEELSFDLVIPSIIGFGFSEKVTIKGCDSAFIADIWHKLMLELGYDKYGAQGGDIGAGISTWLSLRYANHILGLHLNYIPGSYQPYIKEGQSLEKEEIAYQEYASQWYKKEGAYAHIHSTKPISMAYGLNDSPIGLCAWIIEKFNS